ncbi:MAG: 4-hydroxybenzoate octaprenyltransferase [Desulfatiglandales bacterium]
MEAAKALKNILLILNMIKVEHTLFGLPMALSGMLLAQRGLPDIATVSLIALGFASLRAAAMTFNRIVDRHIDRLNPRTMYRELPSGKLGLPTAYLFFLITSVLFFFSAYKLNPLCLKLSPLAYILLMGYSFTKRFTYLSHYILGLCLGLSPLAGYIGVSPSISLDVVFLSLFVIFWVSGFDIIYACQDMEFDRTHNLFSIAGRFGLKNSLYIARASHAISFVMLIIAGISGNMSKAYFFSLILPFSLLVSEHVILYKYGLLKINIAFFHINSSVSIAVLISIIAGLIG